jgi:release factor glutamine methyltransferase
VNTALDGLLDEVETILRAAGLATAATDARDICAACATLDATGRQERAVAMARRRARGEPIAYIVGHHTFMGVRMLTAEGALVPRAETELLGAEAIEALRSLGQAAPRVIDMCCGAGNLACAIASHFPGATVWASDLTDSCVALATRNVEHLGLADRVRVLQGDLFGGLASQRLEGSIDVIVCNPPYISQGRLAADRAALLEHEPREAFDGGPYGLSIHQRVVKESLPFLKPGGVLLFEVGLGQDRQVKLLFDRTKRYEEVSLTANAAGEVRVVSGRRRRD